MLLHARGLVITVLSLVGLVVSARSLQLGPPVAVIAITSAAANLVTIAAGPVVFGEPLPDAPAPWCRLVGFVAVVAGASLTPGPQAEAGGEPEPAPEPGTTDGRAGSWAEEPAPWCPMGDMVIPTQRRALWMT